MGQEYLCGDILPLKIQDSLASFACGIQAQKLLDSQAGPGMVRTGRHAEVLKRAAGAPK